MKLRYMKLQNDTILFAKQDGINLPNKAILSVGAWKKQVEVACCDTLGRDCIGVNETLFPHFKLPEALDYAIKIEGRTITLGPVIGFVAISREKEMNEETLNKKLEYFYRYREIGGLVFVCQSTGFDFSTDTVRGYAYVPANGAQGSVWQEGVFPLPAALYKKVDLSKETTDKLLLRMGDKIFNGYFFDKLELYQYLKHHPKTNRYLPKTVPLTCLADAQPLLQAYQTVYLKPLFQHRSKGIVAVSKTQENRYLCKAQHKKDFVCTAEELQTLVSNLLGTDRFIAQQGIEVPLYEGRRYDFRVILQKGYAMQWECTAMFARFGAVDAPVSNFTVAGYGMDGYEAIKKAFGLSAKEAFILKSNIITACKTVCEKIDCTVGNYGDVGIDVVVDKNHAIWVLEINKLHDHHFPIAATNDRQLYYEIVTKPFFYAKALAGF